MSSLRQRDRQPELMDDPQLDPAEHRRALAGLARVNAVTGSVGLLWPAVYECAQRQARPLRVLDLATGSGDIPLGLHHKARRASVALELHACDVSPTAIAAARQRPGAEAVQFFTTDVLKDALPTGFDVLTCSLFFHHLDDDEVRALLKKMAAATAGHILIADLVRSRFNYAAVWLGVRLLTRSPVVHVDGPLSIQGAYTVAELAALAEQAGLAGATIRGAFPCRMLLRWSRPV